MDKFFRLQQMKFYLKNGYLKLAEEFFNKIEKKYIEQKYLS